MEFVPDRVRENARQAATFDLLERIIIQRDEMEPEALSIIMQELLARNIRPEEISEYEDLRQRALFDKYGDVLLCLYCNRPAVYSKKGWFKLFRIVPIYPMMEYCCEAHIPREAKSPDD